MSEDLAITAASFHQASLSKAAELTAAFEQGGLPARLESEPHDALPQALERRTAQVQAWQECLTTKGLTVATTNTSLLRSDANALQRSASKVELSEYKRR